MCAAWNSGGNQPIATAFNSFYEFVVLHCVRYFEGCDYVKVGDMEPWENFGYCQRLLLYVQSHAEQHVHLRNGVGENLVLAVTEFVLELEVQLEPIRLIGFHLALDHSLDTLFRRDWETPQPAITYLLWDHKAKQKN